MARAPNICGTIDIRSAALLMDYVNTYTACAPDSRLYRQGLYEQSTLVQPTNEFNDRYDRPRDWAICFASFTIILCVIGFFHSFAVFVEDIKYYYELGPVEIIFIASASYAIFLLFSPASSSMIAGFGHRVTAIIGLFLLFIGVFLNSFTLSFLVLYLTYLTFIPIGGSMAYTAAVCLPCDLFRKHLAIALTIISIAVCIGSLFFYWVGTVLDETIGYNWTMICFSLLFLVLIGVTQLFPRRCDIPNRQALPWIRTEKSKRQIIQECIRAYKDPDNRAVPKSLNSPDKCKHPSCIFVIVCDCSVLTDSSYLLWGIITFFAMMAIYVPYLFIVSFIIDNGGGDRNLFLPIVFLCVMSLCTRAYLINNIDMTFWFNRTLLQITLFVSGIIYLTASFARTYGWLLVWSAACGAIEGLICSIIPRLTLHTVPKYHLVSGWVCSITIDFFAVLFGCLLVIGARSKTGYYHLGFQVIGALQILGVLLIFLLPNENVFQEKELLSNDGIPLKPTSNLYGENENDEGGENGVSWHMLEKSRGHSSRRRSSKKRRSKSRSKNRDIYQEEEEEIGPQGSRVLSRKSIEREERRLSRNRSERRSYLANNPFVSNITSGLSHFTSTYRPKNHQELSLEDFYKTLSVNKNYARNCPICSKYGCIPGCCPECIPAERVRPTDCDPDHMSSNNENENNAHQDCPENNENRPTNNEETEEF